MRTSQTSNFLKSLPIVAGCLGERLGVSVRFGDAAYTDGKCITLPAFMNEREITREEMLGFIVHEASHIRYTDMEFCPQTNPAPLLKSFINSIEDARIEKLIAEEYAGARHLLRCAHEPLMTEFLNSGAKLNPQSALSLYLLAQCESTYLKEKLLLDVRDVLKERCLRCFGAPLMAEIDAELSAFPSAANTAQAGAIAERIYQLLLNQLPPEDNPQQSGAGSSGQKEGEGEEGNNQTSTAQGAPGSQGTQCSQESRSNAEAGEADGSNSASQSPESQKDSSGQGSKSKQKASGSASNSDPEKGNSSSDSAEASDSDASSSARSSSHSSACGSADSSTGSSADSSQDSCGSEEMSQGDDGADQASATAQSQASGSTLTKKQASALKKALEATEKSIKSADLSELKKRFSKAADGRQPIYFGRTKIESPMKANGKNCRRISSQMIKDRGAARLTMAKADSVKARRALTGIVQARTRCGVFTAASGRRLQVSKLARLTTGSTRVFERREEAKGVDTAVALLLDLSGSVGGSEDTAIRASLALKTALETIPKVSSCLTVFPADSFHVRQFEPCVQIVPFGERSDRCTEAIGRLFATGCTPLAPTLLRTAVELSKRKEARKIIIVVTDGELDKEAETTLRHFADSGITLAGIGVGISLCYRSKFRENFALNVIIDDFEKLQETLMNLAKQLMLDAIH